MSHIVCSRADLAPSCRSSAPITKSLCSFATMAIAEVKEELEGGVANQLQDLVFNAAGYHATLLRERVQDDALEITCRCTSVTCVCVDVCVRVGSFY